MAITYINEYKALNADVSTLSDAELEKSLQELRGVLKDFQVNHKKRKSVFSNNGVKTIH